MASKLYCVYVILLLSICGKSEFITKCPDGWKVNGNSCYKFDVTPQNSVQTAEGICAATLGAHLASIMSEQENNWIAKNIPDKTKSYYLGYSSHDKAKGLITWTDGSTGNYTKSIDTKQAISCLMFGQNGNWLNSCAHNGSYICKKPVVEMNSCKGGQLVCSADKKCIDFVKICDGTSDCSDKSDEKHCRVTGHSSTSGYPIGLGILAFIVFVLTAATIYLFFKVRQLRQFENIQNVPLQATRNPNDYDNPKEITQRRQNRANQHQQAAGGGRDYVTPQVRLGSLMSKKNSKKQKKQNQQHESEEWYENQNPAQRCNYEDDGLYANHQDPQQQEQLYENTEVF